MALGWLISRVVMLLLGCFMAAKHGAKCLAKARSKLTPGLHGAQGLKIVLGHCHGEPVC